MHSPLSAITVILHRPQEAVNIGSVIRAMKNMGIHDLRLVQPTAFEASELLRVAHRCEDILEQMTVYATLDAALADLVYVVGTAAIQHHKRPQTNDIRAVGTDLTGRTTHGRVGLLFGQEDDGLDNDALDRCHLLVSLPSNPAYPALNLAQSVLLLLYEMRMAASEQPAPVATPTDPTATQRGLTQLFQLSEEILERIGFFRYNPAMVMRTLRQITYRAALTEAELKLLLAITRKISRQVPQQAEGNDRRPI